MKNETEPPSDPPGAEPASVSKVRALRDDADLGDDQRNVEILWTILQWLDERRLLDEDGATVWSGQADDRVVAEGPRRLVRTTGHYTETEAPTSREITASELFVRLGATPYGIVRQFQADLPRDAPRDVVEGLAALANELRGPEGPSGGLAEPSQPGASSLGADGATMDWIEIIPGLWRTDYDTTTKLNSNSVLVSLGGKDLAVVSPAQGADEAFFRATDALGTVVALVAPNSGHDLGQAAWQARYPDATTHAPEVTAKAIAKAKPALRPFSTMAALAERSPPAVRFLDLGGTSSGSVALSVEGGGRRALVVDDCLSNAPQLIGPAPVRFVFWMTGSGPGLAANKLWWWVFCKDRKSYAKALLEEWDRAALDVVVPLHGEEIRGDDVARARGLIAARGR